MSVWNLPGVLCHGGRDSVLNYKPTRTLVQAMEKQFPTWTWEKGHSGYLLAGQKAKLHSSDGSERQRWTTRKILPDLSFCLISDSSRPYASWRRQFLWTGQSQRQGGWTENLFQARQDAIIGRQTRTDGQVVVLNNFDLNLSAKKRSSLGKGRKTGTKRQAAGGELGGTHQIIRQRGSAVVLEKQTMLAWYRWTAWREWQWWRWKSVGGMA